MIKISKQSDYALQLLGALGRLPRGSVLSLNSFAVESNISFLFLQKIAGRLRSAGIIKARPGRAGGYYLRRPFDSVSLEDVITAVDGSTGVSACTRRHHSCPKQGACALEPGMNRLHAMLNLQLRQIKLVDL